MQTHKYDVVIVGAGGAGSTVTNVPGSNGSNSGIWSSAPFPAIWTTGGGGGGGKAHFQGGAALALGRSRSELSHGSGDGGHV